MRGREEPAKVLYLFDANVHITASNTYYPIDQVPEYWAWVRHQGTTGKIKIQLEIYEEMLVGRKNDDSLLDWLKEKDNQAALLLDEAVDVSLVQRVVSDGYAPDLTDSELEEIGRDPFLIAYSLVDKEKRCVVTTEVSKPSKQRQNRKVPDVCKFFSLECCNPFQVNRALGFHTAWTS